MTTGQGEAKAEIEFGTEYEGIIDPALTGFASLLLTIPTERQVPASRERRSGLERRVAERRVSAVGTASAPE